MQLTNLSQIHVVVKTEVVPSFYMDITQPAVPGELKVGDRCFIYDDELIPSKAYCTGVEDGHTVFKSANGGFHKVLNHEAPLNSFEFNRLLAAKFTPSEKRSSYDQYVINRALSAKVIHESVGDKHEFTGLGNQLAKEHFKCLPSNAANGLTN
jgi:hypothetical protein